MKTNKTMTKFLGAAALLVALGGCSNDLDFNGAGETRTITAEIMDPSTETRSCVDSETLGLGFLGMMWEPADKIGIYGTADVNVPFANEATSNARKTTFSGHTSGKIQYAYFPWSEANNGVAVTALKGNLPEEQTVYADYHVDADYKYGEAVNGAIDTEVRFTHLLSLARLEIDATGTSSLSNENIQSIAFSATHDNQPVKMSGDFNFNATNGVLDLDQTTGTVTKAVWQGGSSLTGHITGFISMLPTLKAGDKLNIVLLTDRQKVSFHVTLAVDFSAGSVYTFPLKLSAYENNKEEYGWTTESVEAEYTETTGTFTCAALNVDGLPAKVALVNVNPNGPQAEGTTKIGQAAEKAGWDFFAVSEDFDFNTQLEAALPNYNHGTYLAPGDWSIFANIFTSKYFDIDGLNLFWKKDRISAANETRVRYDDMEGRVDKGANTCIRKGFRHYEVTVADGVVIDVYITHMNTFSGSAKDESNAYWKVQMSQLRQLRDYVIAKAKANNRPAIIMGDTNMRYTRHAIKEQFIDYIIGQGLTINDPWVDFHRNGYPEFGGKSLMINSKFWKDEKDTQSDWYDTTNDICCYDNNTGEVVDKIFYINVPGAPLQLKADYYKNDDSNNFLNKNKGDNGTGVSTHTATGVIYEDANFKQTSNQTVTINKRWGLADHFPAVAGFTWTLRTPKK